MAYLLDTSILARLANRARPVGQDYAGGVPVGGVIVVETGAGAGA